MPNKLLFQMVYDIPAHDFGTSYYHWQSGIKIRRFLIFSFKISSLI